MKFQQTTLANGLEIIGEINPHAVSTAIGFFVRTGSRDESEELAGVSHFLEHMAFKGSERRSADDVNREFDEIGAKYNAYTTEEHTVFHAAVLPEYLPRAVDLLADLLRPSLRESDFETEKQVILEEIGMYADSPMWTAYDRAMRLFFMDHPLGNTVLGTAKSVAALTPEAMRNYFRRRYSAGNIFVAAAGQIEWSRLVDWIEADCGGWNGNSAPRALQPGHQSAPGETLVRGDFVQECELLVVPGPSSKSPMRMAAEVLATVLGDETGSRLYWALIEPGRVDSVDFSFHEYEDAGAFLLSLSCEPELAMENLERVRAILRETTENGITAEELTQAKNKLAARIVLAAERPQNRLFSVGSNWSYRREFKAIEAELADLAAVTVDSVGAVLEQFPLVKPTTVCLGPLAKVEVA